MNPQSGLQELHKTKLIMLYYRLKFSSEYYVGTYVAFIMSIKTLD